MVSQQVRERRQRNIDEVVRVATEVMSEGSAAGLSLGEVAKRMGMRTPSLYSYFDSKAALCDEIFRRGWTDLAAVMRAHLTRGCPALLEAMRVEMRCALGDFVIWAVAHRAPAELMFWRPIAAWQPSPLAYAAAVVLIEDLSAWAMRLQQGGAIRADLPVAAAVDALVTITAGVITQYLANDPTIDTQSEAFTARIDAMVELFLARFEGFRKDIP